MPTTLPSAALEVAFGRIVAYHAHEGMPPGDLAEGGITVGMSRFLVGRLASTRQGRSLPSTVLM